MSGIIDDENGTSWQKAKENKNRGSSEIHASNGKRSISVR